MARKRKGPDLSDVEQKILDILTDCAINNKPTPKMCDLLRAVDRGDRSVISDLLKRLQDLGHIKITNHTLFRKQVYVTSVDMSTRSTEKGSTMFPCTRPKESENVLVPYDLKGRTFEDARVPKEVGAAPRPGPTFVPKGE